MVKKKRLGRNKKDMKILLQAKIDSLDYLEKELYKESLYYQELIDSISFIN